MENDVINNEITQDFTELYEILDINLRDADKCPVCGGDITPLGHCKMCETCYWSACEL